MSRVPRSRNGERRSLRPRACALGGRNRRFDRVAARSALPRASPGPRAGSPRLLPTGPASDFPRKIRKSPCERKRFCRTFVLTPLQHLLDDAEAQRVIVDDENPQAGGEVGVCDVGRHLARLARSARQTLAERGKALRPFSRATRLEKIRGTPRSRIVAAGRNARLVGRDAHLPRDACGNANDPRDDARGVVRVRPRSGVDARGGGKRTHASFPGKRSPLGSIFALQIG